jgi:hypothetical protein
MTKLSPIVSQEWRALLRACSAERLPRPESSARAEENAEYLAIASRCIEFLLIYAGSLSNSIRCMLYSKLMNLTLLKLYGLDAVRTLMHWG